MTAFFIVAASYLLGSIPFAFLLARQRGIDLRRAGGGNLTRLAAGTERRVGGA